MYMSKFLKITNLGLLGLMATLLVTAGGLVFGTVVAAKHYRNGRQVSLDHRGWPSNWSEAEDDRVVRAARNIRA